MLSTFNENFQRIRDVEQFALDSLQRGGLHGDGKIAEAEYHCQGYTGENTPPADIVLSCKIKVMANGNLRSDFKLNGKRIAAYKIALRLGELGV